MSKAFQGRILWLDLTEETVSTKDIDEELSRGYIGGSGLATKIIWDETTGDTEPLSPENPLIFMTGPLTGTVVPSSSRTIIAALSPLTGIWGQSHSGGAWADELRRTGFDGIVVKGKAKRPVYLWIHNGEAQIKDASHLWGKDTYDVTDLLRSETDVKASVAAIGPAGEKLVRIASVMTDGREGRAAGRCGLGAVMGSKNLKAVVVRGTGRSKVHDEEGLKKSVRERHPKTEALVDMKTVPRDLLLAVWQDILDRRISVKNWLGGTTSKGLAEKHVVHWILEGDPYHCRRCRTSCNESKMFGGERHMVYEALGPLGTQCLIDDVEAVARGYELCNRYGMDTISLGGVISFAMEVYENGLITKADTGGIDLKWGNADAMLEMARAIGMREGFGEILGDGVERAARHIGGIASEYAIHVKGLSLPAHDPRPKNSLALEYATANRGACHLSAVMISTSPATSVPDLEIYGLDDLAIDGTGTVVAKLQDFMCLLDSLACCKFLTYPTVANRPEHYYVQPFHFLEWLNCATGWDLDLKEFLRCGERIFNLQRMINVRRGISRKDDTLPPRMLTHKRPGDATGNLPPLGLMLNEYYSYRGWTEEGIPSQAKLSELDLIR